MNYQKLKKNKVELFTILAFIILSIGYFIPIIDFFGKISFYDALKFGIIQKQILILIASLVMALTLFGITIISLIKYKQKISLIVGIILYNFAFIYIMYLIYNLQSEYLIGFWINLIGFILLNIVVFFKLKEFSNNQV